MQRGFKPFYLTFSYLTDSKSLHERSNGFVFAILSVLFVLTSRNLVMFVVLLNFLELQKEYLPRAYLFSKEIIQ